MSSETSDKGSLSDLSSNLISVTEASQISGFTPAWIRRLISRGEIQGVKIGHNWLTTEEEIREYMQRDRRPGPKTE